jgi:hypothetical protein
MGLVDNVNYSGRGSGNSSKALKENLRYGYELTEGFASPE